MSESSVLGRVAWYQLVTKDAAAANEFYTQVVGWNDEESDGNKGDSDSVWSQVASSGALVTIDTDHQLPAHWRAYVAVPDLAEACEKVLMGGGEVIQDPTDFNGIGQAALATDLLGAPFGMVQPKSTLPPFQHGNTTPGHFGGRTQYGKLHAGLSLLRSSLDGNLGGRQHSRWAGVPNVCPSIEEIGGMMAMRRGGLPHWQQYIHVESVIRRFAAQTLGGSLWLSLTKFRTAQEPHVSAIRKAPSLMSGRLTAIQRVRNIPNPTSFHRRGDT